MNFGSYNLNRVLITRQNCQVSCVNWSEVVILWVEGIKIAYIYIKETSVHTSMHTQAILLSPLECK